MKKTFFPGCPLLCPVCRWMPVCELAQHRGRAGSRGALGALLSSGRVTLGEPGGCRQGPPWGDGGARRACALQGEVVPHDAGGAGRQPALQREHHLRAAGVSGARGPALPQPATRRVLASCGWDTLQMFPLWGHPSRCGGCLMLFPGTPALYVANPGSPTAEHRPSAWYKRLRRGRGRWGGKEKGQPGPFPHQEHLCPSSAPSFTTCWRSA